MKNKKFVVVLLLLFIIAIFGWIGYILFFPKSSSASIRSRNSYPQTFNIESVLAKKISTDYVKSVEMKNDIFSPLVVKLNKEDLISLLKTSDMNVKFNSNLRYLSGVKSHGVNMVTFLLNGKSVTFDFDKSNTHFSWNKSEYVLVYFDPTYEGAVIMNILNGQLYTVTSQGLLIK
jgi:spore coat protein CotH